MSVRFGSVDEVREPLTDPQTRIFSRQFFDAALEREATRAQRLKLWLSLLCIDIDRFSAVNERWGRETGDQVLRAVGLAIRESLRHSDIPCRYQNDEFVIILPETDLAAAQLPAERLRARMRQAIAAALDVGQFDHPPVTVSGGLAELSTSGGSMARLLGAARQGLERARARGGDRILYCAG